MYVKEIVVKKFRNLENVRIGPFTMPSESSDVIALAGPNGGGKSSVLELLGFALSNIWATSWGLRRSFPEHSFEVTLALTPDELIRVKEFLGQNPYDDVSAHFEQESVYYRSFNYEEGRFHGNQYTYDRIHSVVHRALNHPERYSDGFFLKPDRSYPQSNFHQNKLFNYAEKLRKGHLQSLAFNTSDSQYEDMFDFLVQQRYHYFNKLGAYHHKINTSQPISENLPEDPLRPYDELIQELFPGYHFSDNKEEVPSNLFIEIPSEKVIAFQDLSSGEKEVFFILSFFLRHQVMNSVIIVDEPELHLHPELARILVQKMRTIQPRNQIWLATHNPEIIDEVGRDKVIYVTRDRATNTSTVTKGTDEPEAHRRMKEMFGFSGYIGLARRMVFLEGDNASTERKIFSRVFPQYGSTVKFIPARTSENQPRLNAAILNILESDLGWAQFYLLRDRDYLPSNLVRKYDEHSSGRVYVLKRHEIENYLLDEELIAKVQTEQFENATDSTKVRNQLNRIAHKMSGEVLRDMVSFRLNLIYRPEDFSLGKLLDGQPIVSETGSVLEEKIEALKNNLSSKVSAVNSNLQATTTQAALDELLTQCQQEITSALNGENGGWKQVFPGKELLGKYAKSEGLGDPIVFHNALIKEMALSPAFVPQELRDIVQKVAEGKTLPT